MKALLASAVLAAAAAAPLPRELTPGKYEVVIEGLLCRTCTRAVAEELKKLKEVQAVAQDFDRESVTVTIAPNQVLALARLRSALERAAARVDLGTRFTIVSIKYRV